MKEKREHEKEKKSFQRSFLISSKEVKKVMLSQKAIFTTYPKKNLKSELAVDSYVLGSFGKRV